MSRKNPIAKLPTELIRIIYSFLNNLEIMFVSGNICELWRRQVAFPLLRENLKSISSESVEMITEYNHFKTRKIGRNFIRMGVRRFLFEYSLKLYDFQVLQQDSKNPMASISCNDDLLAEYEKVQFYFSHFAIPVTNTKEKKPEKSGFLKTISNLFSKPKVKEEKKEDEPIIVDIQTNKVVKKEIPSEIVIKIALDGYRVTGRTCFLNASLRDSPILDKNLYYPSIGIDFAVRMLQFPEVLSNRYRTQVWDSSYPQLQTTYVNHTTMIFEFFDLTKKETFDILLDTNILQIKRLRTKPLELVFIGTKQDVIQENPQARQVPFQDIQTYCLNNFGGALCVELTLTELKSAQALIWYSVLIQDICHLKNLNE